MSFLYLTTKGWRSGKPHEVEIWFVENASKYYVVSELRDRAHWVRNVKRDPKVSFSVGDATHEGSARTIDRGMEAELALKVSRLMEAKYKWSEGLVVELTPNQPVPPAEGFRARAADSARYFSGAHLSFLTWLREMELIQYL